MIKAIRFEKTGGSDVLQYVDYDLPAPAKGQVQVKATMGAESVAQPRRRHPLVHDGEVNWMKRRVRQTSGRGYQNQ